MNKIITSPKVYLLGRLKLDNKRFNDLLRDEGFEGFQLTGNTDNENFVEIYGRLCYLSFNKPRPGGNKTYIHHVKESHHGNVFEHAVYSFIITGVSRSLLAELTRHRVGMTPSVLSQRYVDESNYDAICPDIIKEDDNLFLEFTELITFAKQKYVSIFSKLNTKLTSEYLEDKSEQHVLTQTEKTNILKKAREAARSVLPNATETKISLTANARAIRHLLEQRGSRFADVEIRKLAFKMWETLKEDSPNIFGDYVVKNTEGIEELDTEFKKI